MKIEIYGLIIDTQYISKTFTAFACEKGDADIVFQCINDPFDTKELPLIAEHDAFTVYSCDEGWLYETAQGEQLLVDRQYRSGTLYYAFDEDEFTQNARILVMMRIVIECRLAQRGVISLHSACVEHGGTAVAFTGESGVGKSSRAEQWISQLNSEWLSGDRPIVDTTQNMVAGLPWDGKEQIFRNHHCPLCAVLDVRRGKTTRLRRLTETQARRVLMQQCFIPMWDTDTAIKIMENISRFSRSGKLFRLFCDRDECAAYQVCTMLYDNDIQAESEEIDLKIREGFTLRRVVGEYMVMPTGNNVAKFDGAVALNEVSAFIYENLTKPISETELLMLILDEYDVERDVAQQDLTAVLDRFRTYGMLDEQE